MSEGGNGPASFLAIPLLAPSAPTRKAPLHCEPVSVFNCQPEPVLFIFLAEIFLGNHVQRRHHGRGRGDNNQTPLANRLRKAHPVRGEVACSRENTRSSSLIVRPTAFSNCGHAFRALAVTPPPQAFGSPSGRPSKSATRAPLFGQQFRRKRTRRSSPNN